MVLISYLKIKRSKFNRKQNYKKIFNQITGENLKNINKYLKKNNFKKRIETIYDTNLLINRFINPRKQYDTI